METYSKNLKKFKYQCLLCGDLIYKKSKECKCEHVKIEWSRTSIFHTIIGEEFLLIQQNMKWILFKEFQNLEKFLTPSQIEDQKKNRKILLTQKATEKNKTYDKRKAKIRNSHNLKIINYYGEPLFESQVEFLSDIEEFNMNPEIHEELKKIESVYFNAYNA